MSASGSNSDPALEETPLEPSVPLGLASLRLVEFHRRVLPNATLRMVGLRVRIPLPPPASPSQWGPGDAVSQIRGFGASLDPVWDVRKGRADRSQTVSGLFSLSDIDAVPLRQSSDRSQRRARRGGTTACTYPLVVRLSCEQSALLGPVQWQIELGQTRRGQLDGLPALQDRVDQLWAQKGEANKPADVAP